MERIAWIEIDGWGVVRKRHEITSYTVDGDDILIPIAQASWTPTDVGAAIQLRSSLGPGFEPRCVYVGAPATDHILRRLPDSPFIGTGVSIGETLEAWIDDHYRISSAVPDWSMGLTAQAQWIDLLDDVTRVLSERLPEGGGVAAAQATTMTVLYPTEPPAEMQRLARTYPVPTEDGGGGALYLTAPATWDSDTIETGAPASSSPRVVQIGTEAVFLSAFGATNNALRGVLRTQQQYHPLYSPLYDGLATGVGQVVRLYVAPEGSTSLADAQLAFVGIADEVRYTEDMSALQILAPSLLSLSHVWSGGSRGKTIAARVEVREATAAESTAYRALPGVTIDSGVDLGRQLFIEQVGTTPEEHLWIIAGESVAYALEPLTESSDEDSGFRTLRRTYTLRGVSTAPQGARWTRPICSAGRAAQAVGDIDDYYEPGDPQAPLVIGSTDWPRPADGATWIRLPSATMYDPGSERWLRPSLSGPRTVDQEPVVVGNAARDTFGSGAEFGWVFQDFQPPGSSTVSPQGWDSASAQPVANAGQHVVDVLLAVLTTTGTGRNTFQGRAAGPVPDTLTPQGGPAGFGFASWDYLPASFGLGIPADLIDLASFYRFAAAHPYAFVSGLWIGQSDQGSIAQWLSTNVLEPWGLVLATADGSSLRLIDPSQFLDGGGFDDYPVLTTAALHTDSDGIPRNAHSTGPLVLSASASLEQRRYDEPSPDKRISRRRVVSGSEIAGISTPLARIARDVWAVTLDRGAIDEETWSARAREWLAAGRDITSAVVIELDRAQTPRIGDTVVLTGIPVYPGISGARGLTALAQVVQRDVDIQTDLAVTTFLVSGRDAQARRDRWAPGGRIVDVTSATEIEIAPHEYIPPTEAGAPPATNRFASDPSAFLPGSQLLLVDSFFDFVADGAEVASVAGNVVTLSPGFGLTPEAGQVILLAPVGGQPGDVVSQWAWADGDSTWQ